MLCLDLDSKNYFSSFSYQNGYFCCVNVFKGCTVGADSSKSNHGHGLQ